MSNNQVQVCSPYITRNGRRVFASEYGIKAFCWFTTPEKQEEYLRKKAEREAKKAEQGEKQSSQAKKKKASAPKQNKKKD